MGQKNRRPVILVVDPDEGYVNALEINFIKNYIDKADLEFITDRRYLKEYLEADPIVSVLVVSEAIYSQELQQLTPIYTFILTDEMGREKIGDNTYGIFRYSSGQSIIQTIENKVPDDFFREENFDDADDFDTSSSKDLKVILVTSASGGVGKTTTALGLAMISSDNSEKSMYYNFDYISNYERWLIEEKDDFCNQILEVNRQIEEQSDAEEKLRVFYKTIQLKKYNSVIVDAGINSGMIMDHFFERADLILLMTGNHSLDIYASNKLYRQLGKWREKCVYICRNTVESVGAEVPEYRVKKYISHMERDEFQKITDLKVNNDFCQLYHIVKHELNNIAKEGIELL